MYDAVADDYCYPDTTILRNKLDLRDAAELADFEAEVSDARADEEAPAGDLDFKHFKAVHLHLFQDVYDWAGEIRTVRMSNDGSMFCYPENIEGEAKKLFTQLKQDGYLKNSGQPGCSQFHFMSDRSLLYSSSIPYFMRYNNIYMPQSARLMALDARPRRAWRTDGHARHVRSRNHHDRS